MLENVSAPVIETLTLKELSEKTSSDYLKRNFMCKVKVKNVEQSDSWWYQIIVLAEDETEAFNIVLLDRAARRLIEKTATKLIAKGISDEIEKTYPTIVKEISGKDITVQIELNDDNILLNSTVYHATDAYQSIIDTPSKSETTISGFGASGFRDVST
ncbi:hypothetical protein POM88_006228 [Heracleum sosnowskyi]|uniref:Uncharacterized protein n=1 Tax=Heracleum sosnowskyi TaxID=360622 RepID=A0AAD8J280_9APIA|nr:hypothetical protein POM88_006228 [Heracleum sosnowskyi]